jgi:small subunit ribosomal protein S17
MYAFTFARRMVCKASSTIPSFSLPQNASKSLIGLQQYRNLSSNTTTSDTEIDIGLAEEYKKEVQDILDDYDERAKRKQSLVGIVTSTKNTKTITIEIENRYFYPKYNKYISRHKKIMAHDEEELGKDGDLVRIVPCRPKSRRKRHSLIDIIRRAET